MPAIPPSPLKMGASRLRSTVIQIFAGVLFCGGLFSISLPVLSFLAGGPDETASAPPAFAPSETPYEVAVDLPTEDLHGREALECDLKLLHEGLRLLKQTSDYTGTFYKHERINGVLDHGSLIEVKSRHKPLSLYLKWLEGDAGRELLFVEGQHDNEMLVRLGGIRGRLLPVLKIDPDGEQAREKIRHHVSHVSLLKMARTVVAFREQDLNRLPNMTCELIVKPAGDDAGCLLCVTEYESPSVCAEYRKTIHLLDPGTLLPVTIKTYGWPLGESALKLTGEALDAETLLEHYSYSQLRFNQQLADKDFDRNNPDYNLHRRF